MVKAAHENIMTTKISRSMVCHCSRMFQGHETQRCGMFQGHETQSITLAPSSLKNSSRIQEFSGLDDPELAGSVEGSNPA